MVAAVTAVTLSARAEEADELRLVPRTTVVAVRRRAQHQHQIFVVQPDVVSALDPVVRKMSGKLMCVILKKDGQNCFVKGVSRIL